MPTRFKRDIPSDTFIDILTDTDTSLDPDFVVGKTYNVQAVGQSKLVIVESATEPSTDNPGVAILQEGERIPFIVQAGLGIWMRSVSAPGIAVFNDSEVS